MKDANRRASAEDLLSVLILFSLFPFILSLLLIPHAFISLIFLFNYIFIPLYFYYDIAPFYYQRQKQWVEEIMPTSYQSKEKEAWYEKHFYEYIFIYKTINNDYNKNINK